MYVVECNTSNVRSKPTRNTSKRNLPLYGLYIEPLIGSKYAVQVLFHAFFTQVNNHKNQQNSNNTQQHHYSNAYRI